MADTKRFVDLTDDDARLEAARSAKAKQPAVSSAPRGFINVKQPKYSPFALLNPKQHLKNEREQSKSESKSSTINDGQPIKRGRSESSDLLTADDYDDDNNMSYEERLEDIYRVKQRAPDIKTKEPSKKSKTFDLGMNEASLGVREHAKAAKVDNTEVAKAPLIDLTSRKQTAL